MNSPAVVLRRHSTESPLVRSLLIGTALAFLTLCLLVPLAAIFVQAFADGMEVYIAALREPEALHALKVTGIVLSIVLPLNLFFGLAAAWSISRFEFPGKQLLITFIDLPFSVSPVISGLIFVLLFVAQGFFGPWLAERDISIIFAVPGIVLATLFVTAPFVARELIPLMQEQGADEELAALSLGATGWQMFWRITVPKIRWGLLYGVILLSARAIGEFGAVSVVSGHVRGETNTAPLHVEILYNEYSFTAAFAVASVLALVALLGPSGSGKTTLLRVIAGLDFPDSGRVLFDDVDASQRSVQQRNVGFVFQHYALFRHMTVFENVAFGLRVRPRSVRPDEETIRARVQELLTLVQLEMLANRYPSQLSGGQRQRVALARALAVQPRVLLLDEPFGALDAKVRQELRRWLRRLHDELHVTSVFVTHDQEEALELADRVVIMNAGRIEQIGTPDEVYSAPQTPFVYQFIGDVNLFHGRLESGRLQFGSIDVRFDEGADVDSGATVGVRPHQLTLETSLSNGQGFPATVVHINGAGPMVKMQLRAPWGDLVRVEIPQERYRALGLTRKAETFVKIEPQTVFVARA